MRRARIAPGLLWIAAADGCAARAALLVSPGVVAPYHTAHFDPVDAGKVVSVRGFAPLLACLAANVDGRDERAVVLRSDVSSP